MKSLIRLVILMLALTTAWMIREQLIASSHRRLDDYQWVHLVDEPPPLAPKPESPPEPLPEPEPVEEAPEEAEQGIRDEPQEALESTDEALGVEEEGSAGSDSFGLRAKKGGKDLLQFLEPRQAKPSVNRGPLFLTYGGTLASELETFLKDDPALRGKNFVTVVKIWVNAVGRIERCSIDQSSGNRAIDDRILRHIQSFSGQLEVPPRGMPQPIIIRIRSKIASGLSWSVTLPEWVSAERQSSPALPDTLPGSRDITRRQKRL
jgi:TonB family protein